MSMSVIEDTTIRQMNNQLITDDPKMQELLSAMRSIERFMGGFGNLSFGRDSVVCRKHSFTLQRISTSCELTVGSIISCCENGCIADAYSLLRKYMEDLFFYLYIVTYNEYVKTGSSPTVIGQMEENIDAWLNNKLSKELSSKRVMKAIAEFDQVSDAVEKYNMHSYFDKMAEKFNNFVHGNGRAFYNRNINDYKENELFTQMDSLQKDLSYITTSFVFLLALCSPIFIMSPDGIDCLEFYITPPENYPYSVAPFVTCFFKENLKMIDNNCIPYLRDRIKMEI